MAQLNRKLLSELQKHVPKETLSLWSKTFVKQQQNDHKKINTPATNCTTTSWRKQGGNAIDRIKKKRMINQQMKEKQKEQHPQPQQDLKNEQQQNNGSKIIVTQKTLIKNKAVFFGEECQLPYLHSSDAISHLYVRKKRQSEAKQEILYNPAGSIDRSYMTSLKSLHIYHASIQSLRQLGTGWCSLKELSILYGKLVDISGLSSFSSLEYLFLAFNQITSLSDIMFHPSIKFIDLERNRIENAEEIQYLATMDRLEYVNLTNNPVMKVKEAKRIIQQKLGKKLDLQDYTRLQEYELEEMVQYHNLLSFQNMEATNHLIKICNQSLKNDEVSLQNLYQSYQQISSEPKQTNIDFVRYEAKHSAGQFQESIDGIQQTEEEIFFTPLIHFLSGKKYYTNTIRKYFENKVYLNLKKVQHNQSPAHSLSNVQSNQRLNKFSASLKAEKDQVYSLDKRQSLTSDLNSLQKAKRTKLSLGRTKRLLQKYDNKSQSPSSHLKFANNLATNSNLSAAKTFTLKRSLLKKPALLEADGEIEKKFSKTTSLKYDAQ